MKNVLWLVVGIGIGFIVAHETNKCAQGKKFFDDLNAKTRLIGDSVVNGYHEREAEIRSVLKDEL